MKIRFTVVFVTFGLIQSSAALAAMNWPAEHTWNVRPFLSPRFFLVRQLPEVLESTRFAVSPSIIVTRNVLGRFFVFCFCPPLALQLGERRFNQALFVRLRAKDDAANGGTFCVGTYHMPCLFNARPVMVMHTSMVIKHLARLAGSDPLVFAGDFNFNPDSECYKLATEGARAFGVGRRSR